MYWTTWWPSPRLPLARWWDVQSGPWNVLSTLHHSFLLWRCLSTLVYVPPSEVVVAFDLLSENKPGTEEETSAKTNETLTYFEHTYVRGRHLRGRGDNYGYAPPLFAISLRHKYAAGCSGIARTTNITEGFHYGIQSLFQCRHPYIWTLLKGIKADIQKQKAKYLSKIILIAMPL